MMLPTSMTQQMAFPSGKPQNISRFNRLEGAAWEVTGCGEWGGWREVLGTCCDCWGMGAPLLLYDARQGEVCV